MKIATLLLLAAGVAMPQGRSERYVLVLSDPPLAVQAKSRIALTSKAFAGKRQTLAQTHRSLEATLADRGVRVIGRMDTLANVVFVTASEGQARQLGQLPGVKAVVKDVPVKRHLSNALDLIRAREAWTSNVIGGEENAGRDIRIGILDTGIEQTHPAFDDPDVQPPPDFPKGDTDFTNNKVIVARSYVDMLVLPGDIDFSRPDDLSPRDRVGHGTAAAMVAAGRRVEGPLGTITGVAPKAFLGNYKIFGSPGVNDITFASVVAQAIEDAFYDGMDIVSISAGSPALWGPYDTGPVCPEAPGVFCDWRVEAVQNAVVGGMIVIASAGNEGDLGARYPDIPTYGSVNTPGTAPGAITVGASTNSHEYFQSVKAGDTSYRALFGNGPHPTSPMTARLADVSGTVCEALPSGSLQESIALVLRGGCAFETKIFNAQNAGAAAVIIYQPESEALFQMDKLTATGIPALLVAKSTADTLKQRLADNGELQVTIDASWSAVDTPSGSVAYFSSIGPALGTNQIKPEILGVGTDLYVATQTYDPNGDMYDGSGFTAGHGTSLAAPMVAGAAALTLQANPQWFQFWSDPATAYLLPASVKSALVNTARPVLDVNGAEDASVTQAGAGQLDTFAAVRTTIIAAPATLSFGAGSSSIDLELSNYSDQQVTLNLRFEPRSGRGGVSFNRQSLTLRGGYYDTVTVNRTSQSTPGIYEGFVIVEGGPVTLRIPYLYLVGDHTPANIMALRGPDFTVEQNGPLTLTLRVTDRYGLPVPGAAIAFAPLDAEGNRVSPACNQNADARGNDWGCIDTALEATDSLGITEAKAFAGSRLGEVAFEAYLMNGDLSYVMPGRVRIRPSIDRIVNLGSGDETPLVPGSAVAIFGHALSSAAKREDSDPLPYSLLGVSVSFDLKDQGRSYAGRLSYVSEGELHVQAPSELAGETSVSVKISIGSVWSPPRTFRVADTTATTESQEYKKPVHLPITDYSSKR